MAVLIQLTDSGTGLVLAIDKQQIRIGRGDDSDICFDDELTSKHHAVLEVVVSPEDNHIDYIIQDLDSTNHVFVNDDRVDLKRLRHGDVIRIGVNYLRFEDETKGNLDETAQLVKTWIPGVFYTTTKKKKSKKKKK